MPCNAYSLKGGRQYFAGCIRTRVPTKLSAHEPKHDAAETGRKDAEGDVVMAAKTDGEKMQTEEDEKAAKTDGDGDVVMAEGDEKAAKTGDEEMTPSKAAEIVMEGCHERWVEKYMESAADKVQTEEDEKAAKSAAEKTQTSDDV